MRVWLDPARMAAQGMNTEEVIAAVSKQNVQASLGSVGAALILIVNIPSIVTNIQMVIAIVTIPVLFIISSKNSIYDVF